MVGEVTAVIRGLSKTGLTMLIVTHEMNFAKRFPAGCFYMDERGIYEQGTPAGYLRTPKTQDTGVYL